MPKKINRKRVREDRAALAAAFPMAFMEKGHAVKFPLKIGIHRDVIAAGVIGRDGKPLSAKRICAAIADYCSGPKYAWGVMFNPVRRDLDGKPAGAVNGKARQYAQDYLTRRGDMLNKVAA